MSKIPVYLMPGMAANASIFERIKLPFGMIDLFFLEWLIPLDEEETLPEYAARMAQSIKHENPVLIGVSFGGILVQEIAKIIQVRKVIIISSVKSNQEFPYIIKLAKKTKIYKLIPIGMLSIEKLLKLTFSEKIKKRLQQYQKFLSVTDPKYLNWAIEQVVFWDRCVPDDKVIHIQGDRDEIFPIKNIKDCICVKKGTHIMIINKYKWFNEYLLEIILKDS